jgi:hypothetical protein
MMRQVLLPVRVMYMIVRLPCFKVQCSHSELKTLYISSFDVEVACHGSISR